MIYVDDHDSALGCRDLLLGEGILAGGSSGAVIAAIQRIVPHLPRGSRVVAVLPDRGERYMDLVYDDDWVAERAPATRVAPPPAALVPAP